MSNPAGYRNRHIFALGLALGTRPTELAFLEIEQFNREILNAKPKVECITRRLAVLWDCQKTQKAGYEQ